MKVIRKRPGEEPETIEIETTLAALQKEVGGYIEVIPLDGMAFIVNEEGKLHGLPENFRFGNDVLVGTVLLVGTDGDEFCGLTDGFYAWLRKKVKA